MVKEERMTNHQYITYLILFIGVVSWLIYVKFNECLLSATKQVIEWILKPEFYEAPILHIIPLTPIFALPLILSSLLVYHLLHKVEINIIDKIVLTAIFSFSFAGWAVIIFGILHVLHPLYINMTFCLIILCLALPSIRYKALVKMWISPLKILKILITIRSNCSLLNVHAVLLVSILGVVSFFYFYHAIMYPVDGWDELIYHATMSKVIFMYHTFPVIVGSSVGIEMSSNYPPLFPAIATYFYIQLGAIDEFFIKLISPISAMLTIYLTYKLGELLRGGTTGLLSSLFIAITPLFINHTFYANCYMLQALLLVSALYFVLLYLKLQQMSLLVITGLLTGFALTTGYNAIPIFLVLTSFIILKNRGNLKGVVKYAVPLVVIGSPWYLRNLFLIGDPIFPYLTYLLHLPLTDLNMLTVTLKNIKEVSYWTAFGKPSPQILDFLYFFAFHRGLFPSLSLLTFVGIIQGIMFQKQLRNYTLLVLAMFIIILTVSGFFIRYLLPVLPLFAILAANPLASIIYESAYEDGRRLLVLVLMLIIIPEIFIPGLPALFGGRNFVPHSPQFPLPSDILFFFKKPGMGWYEALKYEYGDDVDAWMYLDAHLKDYERVLTMEQRIYYIKGGDPKYFIFLDSDKVKSLYDISSPEEITSWLNKHNISYIYLASYPLPQHIARMPIIKLLGSPHFPIVFWKPNPYHCIYKVGPIITPITNQDSVYINVDNWMGPINIGNRTAIGIKAGDLAPRIYINTPSPMLVRITYLDIGKGSLDVNLFSPTTSDWYLGLSIIRKEGSGLWREHSFIVPFDPLGFVELGLYAYEDFWISDIRVEPLNMMKYCYVGRLNKEFTDSTQPPTIMILLPPLMGSETILVETRSHYNISVEIFEGIIQLWENTKWWERHRIVARAPELPTLSTQSPSLIWRAKPGLYTLVVVLWDKYSIGANIDLSITIGGSKS